MKADMESIPHRVYIRCIGPLDWQVSIPGVLRIDTPSYERAIQVAQPFLDVLSLCVHQSTQPSFYPEMPVGYAPSEES